MKLRAALLSCALAGAVFAAMPAVAKQAAASDKPAPAAKKEKKWQGSVVRLYKDLSSMDIEGGPAPSKARRKIVYNDSTQWTKGGKPGQQADVKEGSFIIALGDVDKDGVLHATRIDLRLPR